MLAVSITLLVLVAQVDAQAPRPLLDRDSNFTQIDSHDLVVPRIREVCSSRHPTDYEMLLQEDDALADSVYDNPSSASLLTDLACRRALLFALGAPSRAGTLLLPGTSWIGAAVGHLDHALDIDPTNARAAALLAALGPEAFPVHKPAAGEHQHKVFVDPTVFTTPDIAFAIAARLYRAIAGGVRDPLVLRTCTSTMIATGDEASAHDCSMRALSLGQDSTWHLLRLAWFAALGGDTTETALLFDAARRSAHDSSARAELGWHLVTGCPHAKGWMLACRTHPLIDGGLAYAQRVAWLTMSDSSAEAWFQSAAPHADVVGHFIGLSYGGGTFRLCLVVSVLQPYPCAAELAPTTVPAFDVVAQVDRLWDPATGAPITLVPYAVGMNRQPHDSAGDVAGFDLSFRQWNTAAAQDAFDARIDVPRGAPPHAVMTGFLVRPGLVGQVGWSMMVTGADLTRGGVYQDDKAPLDSGTLALSDLVLGQEGQGNPWALHGRDIPVAPQGVLLRGAPVALYVQVRSTTARDPVKVRVVLLPRGTAPTGLNPALQIAFDATVHAGISEIARQLDVSSLKPGAYWFEIRITDAVTHDSSTRGTMMFMH